jgi:periplasmic protein TonB
VRSASLISLGTSLLAHGAVVVVAFALGAAPAAVAVPERVVTALWNTPAEDGIETELPEVEVTAPRRTEAELPPSPLLAAEDALPPAEPMPEDPPAAPAPSADPASLSVRVLPIPRPVADAAAARAPAPRPPAPAPAAIARVAAEPGRVVVSPRPLASNRRPAYPHEARAQGWQGVTMLLVTVGLDGRVLSVSVEGSSGHSLLDVVAEGAVRDWAFTAPVVRGALSAVTVRVPVAFRLTQS